ncbi:MAG: hypothetical protein Q8P49_01570 [Candidatus Liptonbacteria bacterium]|nr:hypothetical protein [Candidatus Liptonbacteria bacterium]
MIKTKSSPFRDALRDFLALYRADDMLVKKICHVVLLGSVRTKEEILGYSDLDVLILSESDGSGTIDQAVLERIKTLVKGISRKYNIEFSALVHTVFDFEEYVDMEYLIHYSFGDVLVGDEKSFKKLLVNILEKKREDGEMKDLIYQSLIHARFNIVRKYVSWNRESKPNYEKAILKFMIDAVIEVCDWALNYRGVFEVSKKGIVHKFSDEYDLSQVNYIPSKTLELRNNWNVSIPHGKVLDSYLRNSILFIQSVVKTIHAEHKKH